MNKGEVLRRARERRGMTLQDIAEKLGVSVNFVWMVEKGRRQLPERLEEQWVETLR